MSHTDPDIRSLDELQSLNGLLDHRVRLAICVLLSKHDAISFSRLKQVLQEKLSHRPVAGDGMKETRESYTVGGISMSGARSRPSRHWCSAQQGEPEEKLGPGACGEGIGEVCTWRCWGRLSR